jgi:parvulin-like peptidyl-prolyl isomerase
MLPGRTRGYGNGLPVGVELTSVTGGNMSVLAKIDDEEISAEDFVRFLKLSGKFDQLLEDIITDRLTVVAAVESGVTVSGEEVQERFDQFRRARGLHRAKATNEFFQQLGVTLDDFEAYLSDMLYKEKVVDTITSESAVKEYFSLNSPDFDSIEVGYIMLDSEGKAREIVALLEEDPESFEVLAAEHSLDIETRDRGGMIGLVLRGRLENELEVKVFNAAKGEVLGPFASEDGAVFEIFKVIEKHSASLDEKRKIQVREKLYDNWLEERAKEHRIEIL